jgi:formylglycine-generating enzyme required for sulfatase activity
MVKEKYSLVFDQKIAPIKRQVSLVIPVIFSISISACYDVNQELEWNNPGDKISFPDGQSVCGNGYKETGETCDDGNTDDCDGGCLGDCSATVVFTGCGDGVACGTEACDDSGESATCDSDCTKAECGDGVINILAGEVCDDGNIGGVGSCNKGCTFRGMTASISGGSFMMGCSTNLGTCENAAEKPYHQVTVKSFEMMKHEVTALEYVVCFESGSCTAPKITDELCNWGDSRQDQLPITCVDWYQARAYCKWAGGRLPTEAEWEYAAKSEGKDYLYPWGNETATCNYAMMDDHTHIDGCDKDSYWVMCFKPNGNSEQGLCDLMGNVWEWVEDDWHSNYSGAPSDGGAWIENPRDISRVVRGGAFYNTEDELGSASRLSQLSSFCRSDVGFRCVGVSAR